MKVALSQNCDRCWKSERVKGQIVCRGLEPGEGCPDWERQKLIAQKEGKNEKN